MKILFSRKYFFLSLAFVGLFIGCKKDDFSKKELFVYTPPGNVTADMNLADFMLARDVALAAPNSGFPATITRPFTKDVKVSGMIVEDLLARYDSINGTTSPELPSGMFKLKNNLVTIPAGETTSVDSFYIDIADISKMSVDVNQFIIPIEINSDNRDVPTSETRQVMYIKANITRVLSTIKSLGGSNTVNTSVNFTPISIQGPEEITFRGILSKAIPEQTEIAIELGSDQDVDTYNAKNNTKYKYFPSGTFSLDKDKVTVVPGAVESADSFAIRLSNIDEFMKDSSYLLVVKVKDEGIVAPNAEENELYIILTGLYNNVNLSKNDVPASLLDRSNWKISGYGDQIYGAANDVLDNNYNTSWMTTISSAWISIDMGETNSLQGIQISPNYAFGVVYNTTTFDIYTSNDGSNWELQGRYSGSTFGGSVGSPDLRNIHFYAPVNASYIRINYLNIGSSGYAGASEIKGF